MCLILSSLADLPFHAIFTTPMKPHSLGRQIPPSSPLLVLGFAFSLLTSPMSAADPPLAEKRPHSLQVHDVTWADDYFWLRDREDPAVKAYLEAENAYLESALAPLKELRTSLVAEMKARIIEEDTSVPYRKGDWVYYSREVAGKDHALVCRRPWRSDAPADLLAPAAPGEEVIVIDRTNAPLATRPFPSAAARSHPMDAFMRGRKITTAQTSTPC